MWARRPRRVPGGSGRCLSSPGGTVGGAGRGEHRQGGQQTLPAPAGWACGSRRSPSAGGGGRADDQLPEAGLPEAEGAGDGLEGADGGRITTSRASLAPDTTGPPTQTGSPVVSALVLVFFPLSRTTVLLTRSHVQVVPSAARTTMSLRLTDWTTPRSNARVRRCRPGPEGELPVDGPEQGHPGQPAPDSRQRAGLPQGRAGHGRCPACRAARAASPRGARVGRRGVAAAAPARAARRGQREGAGVSAESSAVFRAAAWVPGPAAALLAAGDEWPASEAPATIPPTASAPAATSPTVQLSGSAAGGRGGPAPRSPRSRDSRPELLGRAGSPGPRPGAHHVVHAAEPARPGCDNRRHSLGFPWEHPPELSTRQGARHIRSGTGIPSRSSPVSRTRRVSADSASRLSRMAGRPAGPGTARERGERAGHIEQETGQMVRLRGLSDLQGRPEAEQLQGQSPFRRSASVIGAVAWPAPARPGGR